MTKYPLLGKYSSPLFTSRIFSLIITGVATLIFALCAIFIKFPENKKTEYKTVQITLRGEKNPEIPEPVFAEPPVSENSENSEIAEIVEETPLVEEISKIENLAVEKNPGMEEKVEETVTKTAVQEVVTKKTEMPVLPQKNEPLTYAKEITGEISPVKSTKTVNDFDFDAMFSSETANSTVSASAVNRKIENASTTFSGTAGSTANAQKEGQQTSAKTETGGVKTVSENTNSALSNVAKAKATGTANSKSGKSGAANGNDGSLNSITWKGGEARKVIFPKELSLKFSSEAQKILASYSQINITFDVNAAGYFVPGSILITPSVPEKVRSEIETEITDWWFESGSETATASLVCYIRKN